MIRFRRRSPMQDAFDGLSDRDAARLRDYLASLSAPRASTPYDHGESMSPRAGDTAPVTQSGNKRGRRA